MNELVFLATEIIAKKRDGLPLSREEIAWFVSGFTSGEIPDYQAAALLMAAFIRGMTPEETIHLTEAMTSSGRVLRWPDGIYMDKHSTGGVGDKVSLILAPLVASCGIRVPMLSGRSLGHTGGTLDKLESIPGYNTRLSVEGFRNIVLSVGCSIIGQTEDIAPADKRLYALRDATGTVESIPLITASIASKKLAEGIDGLVLDVKCGSGAFMKTIGDAAALASSIGNVLVAKGKAFKALITNMDQPLGQAIGNALEVSEALDVLSGKGPHDVRELSVELSARMLEMAGVAGLDDARKVLNSKLDDGSAREKFREMVEAHGGDFAAITREEFTETAIEYDLKAPSSGFVSKLDAYGLGVAATLLGAGRLRAEDEVNHKVGILVRRKPGDEIRAGDVILTVKATDPARLEMALQRLERAVEVSPERTGRGPLIIGAI
ncbi:MAG: thymidine phosphorylase [candidate division WOR-3 bacterium]